MMYKFTCKCSALHWQYGHLSSRGSSVSFYWHTLKLLQDDYLLEQLPFHLPSPSDYLKSLLIFGIFSSPIHLYHAPLIS